MHVSSSYAKVLRRTNVQPRVFPRSGSKAKDVKEERVRKLVITMASYASQMPTRVAHAKLPGPISLHAENYLPGYPGSGIKFLVGVVVLGEGGILT